jgi:hypothetical protein
MRSSSAKPSTFGSWRSSTDEVGVVELDDALDLGRVRGQPDVVVAGGSEDAREQRRRVGVLDDDDALVASGSVRHRAWPPVVGRACGVEALHASGRWWLASAAPTTRTRMAKIKVKTPSSSSTATR